MSKSDDPDSLLSLGETEDGYVFEKDIEAIDRAVDTALASLPENAAPTENAPPHPRDILLYLIPPEKQGWVKEFVTWLGIDADLTFLQIILNGLIRRKETVLQLAELEDFECPTMFVLGLESIHSTFIAVSGQPEFQDCPVRSAHRNDPTWGIQSAGRQFYALHPYRSGRKEFAIQYDQLHAQLILKALQQWDSDLQKYQHGSIVGLELASRRIRKLASSDCLRYLPATLSPISLYEAQLHKVIRDADDPSLSTILVKKDREAIEDIAKYLAFGDTVDENTSVQRAPPQRITDDESDALVEVTIERECTLTPQEARAIRDSGLSIEEIADDEEFVLLDVTTPCPRPDKPAQRPPPLSQLIRSRQHQIAAIERSNQLSPLTWSRLRPHELAEFHKVIKHLVTDPNSEGQRKLTSDPIRIELAALLNTTFWLAQPFKSTRELVFYYSRDCLPPDGKLSHPGFVLKTNEWCIPRLQPKQSPRFKSIDRSLTEPLSPVMLLPAIPATVYYLHRMPSIKTTLAKGTARAFEQSSELLEGRLKEVLEILDARITLNRIENHLFYALIDTSRDLAAAALTLGHAHRLADTPLHYAYYDMEFLGATYLQVCQRISSEIYAERDADEKRAAKYRLPTPVQDPQTVKQKTLTLPEFAPVSEHTTFVPAKGLGTVICPKAESLDRLRKTIGEAYRAICEQPASPEFLIRQHNLFVLYAVLMLKDATGYRDIKSPLPRRSDIDWDDNTLLVSDKDDAASFNTRVLPLVPVLRNQLIALDRHMQALASRVVLIAPELSQVLFRQFGLSTIRSTTPSPTMSQVPPLFFLDIVSKDLRVIPVRPKELLQQLQRHAPWYQIPTNANRAYLRRKLLTSIGSVPGEQAVPPDMVDYFMAHWSRGQEPLGRFATLPLQRYLDVLSIRLTKILEQDGWYVIEGMA